MQIKTTELTGRALDWAVGVAVGHKMDIVRSIPNHPPFIYADDDPWSPTTNWGQLGPYTKLIAWVDTGSVFLICINDPESKKTSGDPEYRNFGNAGHEDFQIALCRAIVDLYIGDQVDVPEVLCQQ